MKINSEIFRPYDIRGVYPKEINEKIAYLVGLAFVEFLNTIKKQGFPEKTNKKRLRIGLGRDNRFSSPSLFQALKKGILKQGGEVIDIGLVTTPMLYFTVAHYQLDGGIEVSASHLSSEFNGFKLVGPKAIPIGQKTGLEEIKNLVIKKIFPKRKKGKIFRKNVYRSYLDFNFKDFEISNFKSLKLVIDTSNSVPGILIPYLKKKLPCKIFSIFEKLDGKFPNHQPDPLIKKNLRFLQAEVKKRSADLGIAFDGDGDRVFFLDEKGRIVPSDLIIALLAKLILKDFPGEKILYDIRSSNIIGEVVREVGGKPFVNRIGHSFIKERMRKENILFAGEFSGHYYYRNHYFSETPIFVLLKILEELSKTKKNLSQLIKPYKKYFHSGEINFQVKNKEKVLEDLEKKFKKEGKISKIDGLRIDFKDWWFLVRVSGTEDILRLVVEARTKKLLQENLKRLSFLIKNSSE